MCQNKKIRHLQHSCGYHSKRSESRQTMLTTTMASRSAPTDQTIKINPKSIKIASVIIITATRKKAKQTERVRTQQNGGAARLSSLPMFLLLSLLFAKACQTHGTTIETQGTTTTINIKRANCRCHRCHQQVENQNDQCATTAHGTQVFCTAAAKIHKE